jgi:ribonuclease HII
MGYGTKQHLDGILKHGISPWHRKTYGRCKDAKVNIL